MTTSLEEQIRDSYADLRLPDPVDRVMRRGRLIRRARSARRTMPAMLAAALVGTVVMTTTERQPQHPEPADVSLVAFAPPTFPLTLVDPPSSLAAPSYSQEPRGAKSALFWDANDPRSVDSIYIGVSPYEIRYRGLPSTPVVVDGIPGRIDEVLGGSNTQLSKQLVWERTPGQWVIVTGNGRFASESDVLAIAANLRDVPVQVPLQISLAPAGWVLSAYKDNRIMSLDDPDSDDPQRTIDVYLADKWSDRFVQDVVVHGATSCEVVEVNDAPADLCRYGPHRWIAQARTPNERVFVLQAPASLTKDQVLQLASGVSST